MTSKSLFLIVVCSLAHKLNCMEGFISQAIEKNDQATALVLVKAFQLTGNAEAAETSRKAVRNAMFGGRGAAADAAINKALEGVNLGGGSAAARYPASMSPAEVVKATAALFTEQNQPGNAILKKTASNPAKAEKAARDIQAALEGLR